LKKSLSTVLGIILASSVVATANAEVNFKGDARARGIYKHKAAADATSRYYDSRVRLDVTAKTEGLTEASAHARISLNEGTWDGTANGAMGFDYYYLKVPVGDFTISAGKQRASWGNKFATWYSPRDRFKIATKLGGGTFAVFTDKLNEVSGQGGDSDLYATLFVKKFDTLTGGAILIFKKQPNTDGTDTDTGVAVDGFVKGKMGGLDVKGEVMFKSGDAVDHNGNADMGLMVEVGIPMDSMSIGGTVAFSSGGFVSSGYFHPSVMIGTSAVPWAITNFGTSADETAILVSPYAKFKVSDTTDLSAHLSYVSDSGTDANMMEISASAKYTISEKVTWGFDVGYAMTDEGTKWGQDDAMVLGQQINIAF
jgi:hypothetical protein